MGEFQIKVPVHRIYETTVQAVIETLIYTERGVAAFWGAVVINVPVVTMTTGARAGEQVLGL